MDMTPAETALVRAFLAAMTINDKLPCVFSAEFYASKQGQILTNLICQPEYCQENERIRQEVNLFHNAT